MAIDWLMNLGTVFGLNLPRFSCFPGWLTSWVGCFLYVLSRVGCILCPAYDRTDGVALVSYIKARVCLSVVSM